MIVRSIAYLASAVAFMLMDALWLTNMADSFYRPAIRDIVLEGVRIGPAIAFYVLYVVGIVVFAVERGRDGCLRTVLVHGALFGLVAYGTYDLTNQATLKVWPLSLTLVDMAWGSFATMVAAGAGHLASRRFV